MTVLLGNRGKSDSDGMKAVPVLVIELRMEPVSDSGLDPGSESDLFGYFIKLEWTWL